MNGFPITAEDFKGKIQERLNRGEAVLHSHPDAGYDVIVIPVDVRDTLTADGLKIVSHQLTGEFEGYGLVNIIGGISSNSYTAILSHEKK